MAKKQNLSVTDVLRMTPLEILDWLSTQPSHKTLAKKPAKGFLETLAKTDKKARDRLEAMRRRGRVRPHPRNQSNQVLVALEPGAWYGRSDIQRSVPQLPYRGVQLLVNQLWRKGFLQRTENPDYVPPVRNVLLEPRWLYRLTAKGEAKRTAALPFFQNAREGP